MAKQVVGTLLLLGMAAPVSIAGAQGPASSQAGAAADYLSGNTVLLIRHAEKPASGTGLTAEGEHRANAYATYFEPFHEGSESFRVDALYSGTDSKNSYRPRLTLEPLSRASGLPLNTSVGTAEPAALVALLRSLPHGTHPLVCWRHGQIPALLQAFGADAATLLPGGKWPDEVYDWVLVLHFNEAGKLSSAQRLNEQIAQP